MTEMNARPPERWGYVDDGSAVKEPATGALFVARQSEGWIDLIPIRDSDKPIRFEAMAKIDYQKYENRQRPD